MYYTHKTCSHYCITIYVFCIQEKFTTHDFHRMAVFLNPRQHSMKVLPKNERERTLRLVADQLQLITPDSNEDEPEEEVAPLPTKRQRRNLFDEDADHDKSSEYDEVAIYQATKVTSDCQGQ